MSENLSLDRVVGNIKDKIKKSFNAQQMQRIANFCVVEIKNRSRKGIGVDPSSLQERNFKRLTKSYIKKRQSSNLSPFTTPSKSNITFSGRLLAGLRFSTSQGSAVITPTGESRNGTDNKKVASYLAEQGRFFLLLSKTQLKRLNDFITKEIFKDF